MSLDSVKLEASVTVRSAVGGIEMIDVTEMVQLHPREIKAVYTASDEWSSWFVTVEVVGMLSVPGVVIDPSRRYLASAPLCWRQGPGVQDTLSGAPVWVREFVLRNTPIMLVAARRFG